MAGSGDNQGQTGQTGRAEADPPIDLRGRSVLLAEDEFMVALNIQVELEACGANVTVVDSVADGLPLAGNGFDVAVLDVRLADGDVFPLADALIQGGVPIVFHSGHADTGELEAAYPGAHALPKPCWGSEVARTVGMAAA